MLNFLGCQPSVYFHVPPRQDNSNIPTFILSPENKGTNSEMDIIEYFYTSVASINMGIFGGRNHKNRQEFTMTLNIQRFPYFWSLRFPNLI